MRRQTTLKQRDTPLGFALGCCWAAPTVCQMNFDSPSVQALRDRIEAAVLHGRALLPLDDTSLFAMVLLEPYVPTRENAS